MAAATFVTGGLDLLAVGAVELGVGYDAYLGYSYATGGTPNLHDALFWGTIGFGVATVAYGGYEALASYHVERGVGEIFDVYGPDLEEFPFHAPPSSVIRSFDVNGDLYQIGLFGREGNLVERIDVTGSPHNEILTPHVRPMATGFKNHGLLKGWWAPKEHVRATNGAENAIIEFLTFWGT